MNRWIMKSQTSNRLGVLLLAGVLLCGAVALALPSIRHRLAMRSALAADSVDEADLIGEPGRSLMVAEAERLWDTGRLPHRRAVLTAWIDHRIDPGVDSRTNETAGSSAARRESANRRFSQRLIREAAGDPDQELRIRLLGALGSLQTEAEQAAVIRQLGDVDPELRRAGLATLRRVGGRAQIPWVLPLLDDSDPTVVLAADATLRKWTGHDSGLRLSRILPSGNSLTAPVVPSEQLEELRREAAAWRMMLATQEKPTGPTPLRPVVMASSRLPCPPFVLEDLAGKPVHLDSLRGRRVLLNFWATWCPACLVELPVLCELQRRHPDDLVVLGISLDSPDGTEAAEGALTPAAVRELRKTVGTVAARHRLNYRVLLDPGHQVSRRFNGGELPTQVLLDRNGRICRRFVGGRGFEVWEAFLSEANQPVAVAPAVSAADVGESGEQVGAAARR